jgi:hypothetical protein
VLERDARWGIFGGVMTYEETCKYFPITRELYPTEAIWKEVCDVERKFAESDKRNKMVCDVVGNIAACFLWPLFLIP